MDCCNFVKSVNGFSFDSEDYETFKKKGASIIHWLPVHYDLAKVEVLMPDKTLVKGFGEESLHKLKEGSIVQLERFGFCRLDSKKDGVLRFWFSHR